MLDFFTGRSNRQEYWASVGLLILAAMALSYFHMQAASIAITIMWVITWVRRLHDVGMSGWYAAAPIVLVILLVFGAIFFAGNDLAKVVQAMETNNVNAVPKNAAMIFSSVLIAGAIIQFGFTIWLGAKAGDARQNKFGPPPGSEPRG